MMFVRLGRKSPGKYKEMNKKKINVFIAKLNASDLRMCSIDD